MRIVPFGGVCNAIWTYWGGRGHNTNTHSEIDIEIPSERGRPAGVAEHSELQFVSWSNYNGTDWANPGTQRTVAWRNPGVGDLRNSGWHTYAFEWNNLPGNESVNFYFDGRLLSTMTTNVPNHRATFWVGAWFPPRQSAWTGVSAYHTGYMYVDWVRITEYLDHPVQNGANNVGSGSGFHSLGNNAIPQSQR
jgi:hypothetical protein